MRTQTAKTLAADIAASDKTVWITALTQRTRDRGRGNWYAAAWEHDVDGARSQDPEPHAVTPESARRGDVLVARSGHPASWVPDKPGHGSNTTIEYDEAQADALSPAELLIGHELIHARRNARGYQLKGFIDGRHSNTYELEEVAVAGPAHQTLPMTGNRLREELIALALPGVRRDLSPRKYFLHEAYS